ncbi:secretion protein [Paraburkholderia sp. UYCP14C]|uniref:secretion protein n=1 Tax=Paraburkholderia sp. UYCP14C TaxID=2511130 RepID=UPI00102036B1|nr:secretion protein [Paraburkholderia sp. UYCP14C]RZF23812.1 secretion protein [Paraburkholderia sp. UYCP14C]
MTKLLRILTGVHAGAELRLSAGAHRIGTDDDADIRISDWCGDDVSLVVDSCGVVSARRMAVAKGDAAVNESSDSAQGATLASRTDDEPGAVILLDFVPMQFGETVVCIGLDDAAWPSDLELLSTLLVKPEETRRAAERSRRRRMAGIVSACAMLGAVLVIGSMRLTTAVSRAALPRDAGDLAQRVNLELEAAHMKELHAQVRGSTVTVSGMVATAAEDTQLRKMLMRISPDRIVRHYDIAQNDLGNMADSLAMQGLKVVYAGRGAFEISGRVVNPHDVESAVARMRHDLSDNVKDVRLRVAQAEDALTPAPTFSFLMSSDDVRYGQTPDGVKHIYTSQEDAPAAAAGNGPADGNANGNPGATGSADEAPAAARGVMQPVEDIPATPPSPAPRAANTTAYLPLPK